MFIKIVSWNTGFQRLKQIQCDGVTFHKVFFSSFFLFFPNSVFFLTRCKPSWFFFWFYSTSCDFWETFLFDGLFLSSRQRCIKKWHKPRSWKIPSLIQVLLHPCGIIFGKITCACLLRTCTLSAVGRIF